VVVLGWRTKIEGFRLLAGAEQAGRRRVVRRWQREAQTAQGNGKCPQDLKRDAKAAWKRFTWCLRSLPASEAAPLWQAALAEVAAIQLFAPNAQSIEIIFGLAVRRPARNLFFLRRARNSRCAQLLFDRFGFLQKIAKR
jgi:hypothetical protein